MSAKKIKRLVRAFSGLYEKAFFVLKASKIYAGNCDSVTANTDYVAGDMIDKGLDYIIFACSDGAVIFSDLRVDDFSPEQSLRALDEIIYE